MWSFILPALILLAIYFYLKSHPKAEPDKSEPSGTLASTLVGKSPFEEKRPSPVVEHKQQPASSDQNSIRKDSSNDKITISPDELYGNQKTFADQQHKIKMIEEYYSNMNKTVSFRFQPFDGLLIWAHHRRVWGALPYSSQIMLKYITFIKGSSPRGTTNADRADAGYTAVMRAILGMGGFKFEDKDGNPIDDGTIMVLETF